MWTSENRVRYDRSKLRYPKRPEDAQWAHVAPLIPAGQTWLQPSPCRRTRSGQRLDVYPEHGLPVASGSEGFAAALDAL